MTRASIALLFTLAAAACSSKSGAGNVCDTDPPPLIGCNADCDPNAANSGCDPGLHCESDGKCVAQCTPGGTQCDQFGQICTQDGKCEDPMSGSNPPPDACPSKTLKAEDSKPSIGLLLDRSGSMFVNKDGQALNRFDRMEEALVGVPNGVVTQLESKAFFGSMMYTCRNDTAETYEEIQRRLNNAAAIRGSMANETTGLSTPTAAAIDEMVARFRRTPVPADSAPIIVLATDGLPNHCGEENSTDERQTESEQAAARALAAGLPLYVLAMNVTSPHFERLAVAGRGPGAKVFFGNNTTDLVAAFNEVVRSVISCDLKLDGKINESFASQGIVTVKNGETGQVKTLTFNSEWKLVNNDTVQIVDAACTDLKNTPKAEVSATFPCGGVVQ